MSLVLIRRLGSLNLDNFSRCSAIFLNTNRTMMTENEKAWIKENSKKIMEKVKAEKGIELQIDRKQPQLFFEKSQELQTADETIKKLFSLEFATGEDFIRFEEELVKRKFRRSPIDQNSLEIQIAFHTLSIKRMLRTIEESNGRNDQQQFFLYRAIHRRDRLMVQLFHKDNKRYEWLKQQLNMHDYKLKEDYEYKRETRYERFLRELKESNDRKRREKLAAVRREFEKQKEAFFKEKERFLVQIQRELKELGFQNLKLPPITTSNSQKQQ